MKGLGKLLDLLKTLEKESVDDFVFLFEVFKAIENRVGDMQAIVPFRLTAARPGVFKRAFHLTYGVDELTSLLCKLLFFATGLLSVNPDGHDHGRCNIRFYRFKLVV